MHVPKKFNKSKCNTLKNWSEWELYSSPESKARKDMYKTKWFQTMKLSTTFWNNLIYNKYQQRCEKFNVKILNKIFIYKKLNEMFQLHGGGFIVKTI